VHNVSQWPNLDIGLRIKKTRSPTVIRISDSTGCQWASRSSKVDDFYFISEAVRHFL